MLLIEMVNGYECLGHAFEQHEFANANERHDNREKAVGPWTENWSQYYEQDEPEDLLNQILDSEPGKGRRRYELAGHLRYLPLGCEFRRSCPGITG